MHRFSYFLSFLLVLTHPSLAETVKDREGAVRNDRAAMENDQRWIYNDYKQGFEQAKRTGKPLLVVLRCVPCLACAGIDSAVLLQQTELTPLLNQFVCVRVINANALDLALFQTDFDLSFSTLLFNGDGTLYGRYGSWQHQKNSKDDTTAGYKHALEAALKIHKGYPANKASLVGKQGRNVPFKTPVEMPQLMGKYSLELNWNGKVVPSCVHCHQIGDAFRLSYRDKRQPIPDDWIFPYPAPEVLGLSLAPDQIGRISSVAPDSIAAKSGLLPGDELTTLEGQPLISHADVSWVLHTAPKAGKLNALIKRKNKHLEFNLLLTDGWRSRSDISKRVGTWGMRGMASGGLVLEDVPDNERSSLGLTPHALALRVKYVGEYGTHAAAKKAGFKKDDLITVVDGIADRLSEGQFIGRMLQAHNPGESVKATVKRGSETLDLMLPMQ